MHKNATKDADEPAEVVEKDKEVHKNAAKDTDEPAEVVEKDKENEKMPSNTEEAKEENKGVLQLLVIS